MNNVTLSYVTKLNTSTEIELAISTGINGSVYKVESNTDLEVRGEVFKSGECFFVFNNAAIRFTLPMNVLATQSDLDLINSEIQGLTRSLENHPTKSQVEGMYKTFQSWAIKWMQKSASTESTKVKVSDTDPTSGFLSEKIAESSTIKVRLDDSNPNSTRLILELKSDVIKLPRINPTSLNWELWNGVQYVDSGVPSYGAKGDPGPQGSPGSQGPQGSKGDKGNKGDPGSQGYQGNQGSTGYQGPQGVAGSNGSPGPQGPQGEQGNQGNQGPQGNQGSQGAQGPQGSSPSSNIVSKGYIYNYDSVIEITSTDISNGYAVFDFTMDMALSDQIHIYELLIDLSNARIHVGSLSEPLTTNVSSIYLYLMSSDYSSLEQLLLKFDLNSDPNLKSFTIFRSQMTNLKFRLKFDLESTVQVGYKITHLLGIYIQSTNNS